MPRTANRAPPPRPLAARRSAPLRAPQHMRRGTSDQRGPQRRRRHKLLLLPRAPQPASYADRDPTLSSACCSTLGLPERNYVNGIVMPAGQFCPRWIYSITRLTQLRNHTLQITRVSVKILHYTAICVQVNVQTKFQGNL